MSEELVSPPDEQVPRGEWFSLVYLERGKPAHDSERMRHRIGALIYDFRNLRDLSDEIEREIGIEVFLPSHWPSCLVPGFDGAFLSHDSKDALWDKFYTAAPPRRRQSVEQYKIVKRA